MSFEPEARGQNETVENGILGSYVSMCASCVGEVTVSRVFFQKE